MAKTNAARRRAFAKRQEQERASRGCKKRGELAEMAFILKAESLGFEVAKPYGESNRYDFILRSGQKFWKMQIKSTSHLGWGGYMVHAERTRHGQVIPYTPEEIDFLVVHIVPEDTWFIIPVRAFTPHRSVHVYPLGTPTEAATSSIAKPGGCWSKGISGGEKADLDSPQNKLSS